MSILRWHLGFALVTWIVLLSSLFIQTCHGMFDETIDVRSFSMEDLSKLDRVTFTNRSVISSRYAQLFNASLNAPPLDVSEADLPHEINTTLRIHSVSWQDLQGTLQRLLLWDNGYVLTSQSQLVRIYVECGLTMDEIVIPRNEFQAQGCRTRMCNDVLVATDPCASVQAKCATNGFESDVSQVTMWSEEQPNSDIPRPTIFRTANHSYAIHMVDPEEHSNGDNCPTSVRLAIPCVHMISRNTTQWCVPKSSGVVSTLLETLNPIATIRSNVTKNEPGGVMPVIWLSVMSIAAIASVVFVFAQRKVSVIKESIDRTMNTKQLNAPATTVTSENELEFVSVHTHDKSFAILMDKSRSLSALSSKYSSHADLANASEVLRAFENDPFVVEKRIPMTDIEFTRRLCHGASGDVFIGRVHGQRVAIKQLLPLRRNDLDDLECFAREIQLSASLDHPNIIKMIGVSWTSFQNLALILEYRSGGDLLNAICKRGTRWSWNAEKLHIAIGVAKAMVYLHDRAHPVVHRDIKSRNILIDAATLEPALCDFGSSRNVSALDVMSADPAGTILWSAPEVISSQHYTVKADIFSFGIVLAELDTCTLPYTEERDSDGRVIPAIRIAHMVVENRVKPQLSEHCPRFIRELVMKCVKHKPDKRPTADEVLARLTEAANDCAALWKSKNVNLESL